MGMIPSTGSPRRSHGRCGHEKKLICRSLARFGASVFFFLEKIQLRRYYSGANR
jgi:hypothetical protein